MRSVLTGFDISRFWGFCDFDAPRLPDICIFFAISTVLCVFLRYGVSRFCDFAIPIPMWPDSAILLDFDVVVFFLRFRDSLPGNSRPPAIISYVRLGRAGSVLYQFGATPVPGRVHLVVLNGKFAPVAK